MGVACSPLMRNDNVACMVTVFTYSYVYTWRISKEWVGGERAVYSDVYWAKEDSH